MQKLCAMFEQERSIRGGGGREAGRIARDQILVEGGVEHQPALNRASQKITAVALLL
jgi:hypothetical protein